MTSYTNPGESVPLPGAFPMTPTTENPSLTSSGSHPQHNKLHKREDPRGWSDEEKAARGHQYTDSGIGMNDSRTTDPQAYSRANDGAFNSNQDASQSQNVTPDATATTAARSTGYLSDQSKPGVMTGAYSRVGSNSNGQINSKSITQDPTTKEQTTTGIGAVGPATGVATAARSNDSAQNMKSDDRNIVRNGLRQTSNVEHKDPYWGDVSYGTGIYNGVTGHGSSETPVEGSVQPHGASLGHDQQRAFPLSTTGKTTHDETSHRNSSRFKEGLAESGAGASAGVAASELAEKHRDRHHDKNSKEKEHTSHKHGESDTKKESKIAGIFHRDHKEKEAKPEKHNSKERKVEEGTLSKDDSPLKDRDAGAALAAATMAYGSKDHADKRDKKHKGSDPGLKENKSNALYDHPNEKINEPTRRAEPQLSKDPFVSAGYTGPNSQSNAKSSNNAYPTSEDVTTRGHPFTYQAPEKSTEKNDSRLGYGLAAAGAGAGAGYAAHEYANRDGAKYQEHSSQPTYNTPTTATSRAPEQPANSGYTVGQPQVGVASGTTTTIAPEKQHTPTQSSSSNSHSHANPSHHNEYNILADGTPSGINIDNHYGDKRNTATSSPSTGYNTATKDNHTGAKAAATGAGVAGAGAAAYYAGNHDSDKIPVSEARQTAAPGSREVHEPYMETANTSANAHTSGDSSRHGEYNVLNDGTPSGINTGDHHGDKKSAATSSPTGLRKRSSASNHAGARTAAAAGAAGVAGAGAAAARYHSNDNKSVSSPATRDYQPGAISSSNTQNTAAYTKGHTRNRSSTDSSHGGQYNVLSSGTPSGINIGERDHLGRKSLDTHPTNNSANAKSSATAVHPAAVNAGAAPKKDLTSAATAAGVGATAAAAAPAALRSGDRVTHRCRKCGEENDITEYFQK
ncbi:hypothetical protein F5Y13DRAFT_204416 [Hypoxylon sp. FL1857]|nr:hypothetical protein F5Y13DRAFT_204416 [Hypoxylon sp. FL1857]